MLFSPDARENPRLFKARFGKAAGIRFADKSQAIASPIRAKLSGRSYLFKIIAASLAKYVEIKLAPARLMHINCSIIILS